MSHLMRISTVWDLKIPFKNVQKNNMEIILEKKAGDKNFKRDIILRRLYNIDQIPIQFKIIISEYHT